jgi:hypothetical protein
MLEPPVDGVEAQVDAVLELDDLPPDVLDLAVEALGLGGHAVAEMADVVLRRHVGPADRREEVHERVGMALAEPVLDRHEQVVAIAFTDCGHPFPPCGRGGRLREAFFVQLDITRCLRW